VYTKTYPHNIFKYIYIELVPKEKKIVFPVVLPTIIFGVDPKVCIGIFI